MTNINFRSIKSNGVAMESWPIILGGGQIGPDSDGGVINAVDIDWNGAVLPNADLANAQDLTINTTGELLSLITEMQHEIYVLSAAVVSLAGN